MSGKPPCKVVAPVFCAVSTAFGSRSTPPGLPTQLHGSPQELTIATANVYQHTRFSGGGQVANALSICFRFRGNRNVIHRPIFHAGWRSVL